MTDKKSRAQRLGLVLEKVTNQSSRVPSTPEYGSWVLGRVSETQRRRRVRIQTILTTFALGSNLIGVGVAILVVTVTFPVPSVFDGSVLWITFAVAPAYIVLAFVVGVLWATNRVINDVRWAVEEREPTPADQRNTFFAPWRLTRVLLFLWGGGTVVLTLLYGLADTNYIPKVLLGISFPGIVVSASRIPGNEALPSEPGRLTYSSSGRIMVGRWVRVPVTLVGSRMPIMFELSVPGRSVANPEPCLRPPPTGMATTSGGTAGVG